MKVSVSFLSSSIKPDVIIKGVENTNADYIHVDIMDAKFVKQKTWTYGEIKKLTSYTTKKLDVHLMVNNPIKYIDDYALLDTEYITFHYEAVEDVNETIDYIKNYGIRAGISIKPKTNVKEIFPYLKDLDLVLIMSVEPGKSGQEFNESVLYKIEALRKEIEEKHYNCIISVDGGINEETALKVKTSGADMVATASYVHNNLKENIKVLKEV